MHDSLLGAVFRLAVLVLLLPACTEQSPSTLAEADWCKEHGVPESKCTRCNPELIAQFKAANDWCAEHGLPESQCDECKGHGHAANDWCAEHGLPESKCTRCNPTLVPAFIEANDYCREHGYPQSLCPICKGDSPFPPPELRVRLASQQTAANAGIETQPAQKRRFAAAIEVVGELQFDPNRRADLSSQQEALVTRVHADVGDAVKRGTPLITLRSARIGVERASLRAARSSLATANERLRRQRRLHEKGFSSKDELAEAERAVSDARARLQAARATLEAAGASANESGGEHVLRAPFDGTVVFRSAAPGHNAQPGETLIAVADPTRIRAELDVPEQLATEVRPGQRVTLELPGGRKFHAELAAVSPAVDARTRTVKARANLRNDDLALKAGTFVRARIETGEGEETVVIPKHALQRIEGRWIVFVERGPADYRPVAVETGAASGDEISIRKGLRGGERIVTTGAFLLATETRKESIGAGCCEVE